MKTLITTLLAAVILITPTLAIAAEIEASEDTALDEDIPAEEGTEDATVPVEVEPEPTGERAVDIFAMPVETEPAMYGWLSVTTDPTGAKISLDGGYIGSSPITGFTILAGDYRLRTERPEYFVSEFSVTVTPDETEDFHFDLVKKQRRKFGAREAVILAIAIPAVIAVVCALVYLETWLE